MKVSQTDAMAANKLVHTAISKTYNTSPHFRPENKKNVEKIISELRAQLKTKEAKKRLLDMGCGTGFILSLAHNKFDELHGVDITEAMMSQVDLSSGNIQLHLSAAEKTPFAENHFDMVTAYSFIDHLAEVKPFLQEVHRVLKTGGIFYADLNPNRKYWDYLFELDAQADHSSYSAIVKREIENVVHNDNLLAKETGLSTEVVVQCEPTKSFRRGFLAAELEETAKAIGFSKCEFVLTWFMGQGVVMHQESFAAAESIEKHLRHISPASDFLFKYLRLVFQK